MNNPSPIPPPRWPLRLLRRVLNPNYWEELQGDLEERFYEDIGKHGLGKARRRYVWGALRLLRPALLRKPNGDVRLNQYGMFKHNFILTLRNFKKHKSSFAINLLGLSSGLACTLFIALWVNDELQIDKFHAYDDRLYQVLEHVQLSDGITTRRTTSGPMAEALLRDMPEVERAVATTYKRSYLLSSDDAVVVGDGIYASADFFNLFSFELTQGAKNQVLSDMKGIVLSESLATSLFGSAANAVGKTVEWQHKRQYQVSGVFRDISAESSLRPDFLLTFEEYRTDNDFVTSWGNTMPRTYLLLKDGVDLEPFNRKIADFVKIKTEGEITHRTHFATRYSDRYLYGHYENGVQSGGRIAYVRLFSLIALLILVIACINFMNLCTARASRRVKEVGIKKVVGAQRSTLIVQYLSESLLMALFSLLVAVLLVLLLLPQFNLIAGKELGLQFDVSVALALIVIVSFTGLVAGSYPALYLSGFEPSTILKGGFRNVSGAVFARKGLVVFQFALSIILMVAVWVIYDQLDFMQSHHLGYDKENVIFFKQEGVLREGEKLETFISEVKLIPGIVNVSSSQHDMIGHHYGTGVLWPGKSPKDNIEFEQIAVNYQMIETLGIRMQSGRAFSKDFSTEDASIIFNQTATDLMGLSDPIGKVVKVNGREKRIIGVVEDFHFDSFREEIKPVFFELAPSATDKVVMKVEVGKEQEVISDLKRLHERFNPNYVLDYWFLDEDHQSLYEAEERMSALSKLFGGLAIVISCLGLFGLAAFTAERRMKEIGIRKILGSSEMGIISMLSSEFMKTLALAILISLPISYVLTKNWLDDFAYKIDLQWWHFFGAAFVAILVALFTTGLQTVKVAILNPTQYLKDE